MSQPSVTRRCSISMAIAVVFACAARPVLAQFPTPGPTEQPEPFVREALASPYGRALIAELGRALRADADLACLNSKGIAADQLESRGEQLMIKWGTRTMETALSVIDFKAYEKNFPAHTELKAMLKQPELKRYLQIERPLRLTKVLDFVFEQFDRYALIKRIKIASVSPISTGNDQLLRANPAEAGEEALEKFTETDKSAKVKRFLALSEQSAAAMQAAANKDLMLRMGPNAFYRGIEVDLGELCIGSRPVNPR
jgi:hypothetical protein